MTRLVFEQQQQRFEPPADFYNPNLLIATHKTAPRIPAMQSVKRKSLESLLNSKKFDPKTRKVETFVEVKAKLS